MEREECTFQLITVFLYYSSSTTGHFLCCLIADLGYSLSHARPKRFRNIQVSEAGACSVQSWTCTVTMTQPSILSAGGRGSPSRATEARCTDHPD